MKSPSSYHEVLRFFEKYHPSGGITVLSGAGISTDSGIPDYRGPKGAYVVNPDFKPITFQNFNQTHLARQRYWTRSYFGYPKFSLAKPNQSHISLSRLEELGFVNYTITQNVDSLHQKAGSKNIVEIHGSLSQVECLKCKHEIERPKFQSILSELNPKWNEHLRSFLDMGRNEGPPTTPDGDVLLSDNTPYSEFVIPKCFNCKEGFYKPSVVFFGENMTLKARKLSQELVHSSNGMLVIGSSLSTPSAYRLAHKIKELGKELFILNLGPTRADSLADVKIEQNSSQILTKILSSVS